MVIANLFTKKTMEKVIDKTPVRIFQNNLFFLVVSLS